MAEDLYSIREDYQKARSGSGTVPSCPLQALALIILLHTLYRFHAHVIGRGSFHTLVIIDPAFHVYVWIIPHCPNGWLTTSGWGGGRWLLHLLLGKRAGRLISSVDHIECTQRSELTVLARGWLRTVLWCTKWTRAGICTHYKAIRRLGTKSTCTVTFWLLQCHLMWS